MASRAVQNLNYSQCKCINIDLNNTRPQRVFSSVQTCGLLLDVNQPFPWFSHVGQEKNSSTRRKMSALSCFCNILLQGLTPLHVKITRSTNLLSVCRRKLKLSTYTRSKLQPHKLSQCTLATRLSSCQFWILFDNMKNDKQICRLQKSFSKTASIQRKLCPLSV